MGIRQNCGGGTLEPLAGCSELHLQKADGAVLVFLGYLSGSEELVEARLLDKSACVNGNEVDLFLIENHAAAKLKQENVVSCSEVVEGEDFLYYVSEHPLHSRPLSDILDERGWLGPTEALGILRQVAEALDHAHLRGVLHLKLHPQDILVAPDWKVKVRNFGVLEGKQHTWAHRLRTERAVLQYLSPEQEHEERFDHCCDIYALGALFYEMLTDRRPLDGCRKRLYGNGDVRPATPPKQLAEGLPGTISDAVMGMLEGEWRDRYCEPGKLHIVIDKLLREMSS